MARENSKEALLNTEGNTDIEEALSQLPEILLTTVTWYASLAYGKREGALYHEAQSSDCSFLPMRKGNEHN